MQVFRYLLRAAAIVMAASLAACASMPPSKTGNASLLFNDALFKPTTTPVDQRTIFAVDAAMRRFIAEKIDPQMRLKEPRQALLDAFSGKLKIEYDSQMTRTAAQTFAAHEGNCLSLVIMAAALAKQLDIQVTYQQVYDFDTWSRDAGFNILSEHVNLVLGPRPANARLYQGVATPMIVDFLPPRKIASAVSRPVSEQTVIAMYFNNRAAEVMLSGDLDTAYWFARAALMADPGFANAANTLGVIYHKQHDLAAAERAMRYALQHEPDNIPAISNLEGLLAAEGRKEESQVLAKRLAQIQLHPPFYFYDRGMHAMRAGQYKQAARLFEKALTHRPYDVPAHFQLALATFYLGDTRRARQQLALAQKDSTTPASRALYAAKLRHLKALN